MIQGAGISVAERVFTWNPYLRLHNTRKSYTQTMHVQGKTIVRHRHFTETIHGFRGHGTLYLDPCIPSQASPGLRPSPHASLPGRGRNTAPDSAAGAWMAGI